MSKNKISKNAKRKLEENVSGDQPIKKVRTEERADDNTAINFFSWLLHVSEKEFFEEYFEKKHLHFSHGSPEYFAKGIPGIIPPSEWTTEKMKHVVSTQTIHYGTDLNVVRFDKELKKRVSFKVEGEVSVKELTQCMAKGWSVRFLRPHEYISCNSAFIAMMEKHFQCYCGLNSYWTPANSQGFAPHYDDVDVFLLQIEGEKEWNLYDPLEAVDHLSRHSSEDYVPEQFPKPKHSLVLKAGDVLYMPRGMVHQGRTFPHTHSLHITFSANQMNSWADFFLTASRYSVETLSANNLAWRKAVPRQLFSLLGAANEPDFRTSSSLQALTNVEVARRKKLQTHIRQFVAELGVLMTDETNMDFCADEYAKESIRKMQPPPVEFSNPMKNTTEIRDTSRVRLIGSHACRLVLSVDGEAILYHNGENNVVCLAGDLGMLRFEREFAPAIATLLSRSSSSIRVSALPFPDFEDPVDIQENQQLLCESLRDAGLLEEISE